MISLNTYANIQIRNPATRSFLLIVHGEMNQSFDFHVYYLKRRNIREF